MADKIKFTMDIKLGLKTPVSFESRLPVDKETITVADYEKIIDTEKFLERLFGYRFHIFTKED